MAPASLLRAFRCNNCPAVSSTRTQRGRACAPGSPRPGTVEPTVQIALVVGLPGGMARAAHGRAVQQAAHFRIVLRLPLSLPESRTPSPRKAMKASALWNSTRRKILLRHWQVPCLKSYCVNNPERECICRGIRGLQLYILLGNVSGPASCQAGLIT